MSDRLGVLIECLSADLAEALTHDLRAKLALYLAASELLVECQQPADCGALRFAVAHLALQALGVTDASVEVAKCQLTTHRDPEREALTLQ